MSEQPANLSKEFLQRIKHPLRFKLYLFFNLPAALFAGLKLHSLSTTECRVAVPFKWFTKNPFRSTYFACLAMAAEMSTGVLAMSNIYKKTPAVSMLITGMEASFIKKAVGPVVFTCAEGEAISNAVQEATLSGLPKQIRVPTVGCNKKNEIVAEFWFTWSFKLKQ